MGSVRYPMIHSSLFICFYINPTQLTSYTYQTEHMTISVCIVLYECMVTWYKSHNKPCPSSLSIYSDTWQTPQHRQCVQTRVTHVEDCSTPSKLSILLKVIFFFELGKPVVLSECSKYCGQRPAHWKVWITRVTFTPDDTHWLKKKKGETSTSLNIWFVLTKVLPMWHSKKSGSFMQKMYIIGPCILQYFNTCAIDIYGYLQNVNVKKQYTVPLSSKYRQCL